MTCIPSLPYMDKCTCASVHYLKPRSDKFDDQCTQLTVKARCAIIVVLVYEGEGVATVSQWYYLVLSRLGALRQADTSVVTRLSGWCR